MQQKIRMACIPDLEKMTVENLPFYGVLNWEQFSLEIVLLKEFFLAAIIILVFYFYLVPKILNCTEKISINTLSDEKKTIIFTINAINENNVKLWKI